jgi:hypothetical protein
MVSRPHVTIRRAGSGGVRHQAWTRRRDGGRRALGARAPATHLVVVVGSDNGTVEIELVVYYYYFP